MVTVSLLLVLRERQLQQVILFIININNQIICYILFDYVVSKNIPEHIETIPVIRIKMNTIPNTTDKTNNNTLNNKNDITKTTKDAIIKPTKNHIPETVN